MAEAATIRQQLRRAAAPKIRPRQRFRRILFATDFSPACDSAFEYAAMLSKHFGARLYLLHILAPYYSAVGGGVITPALQRVETRYAEERLAAYLRRMPELDSIKSKPLVSCGKTRESIVEAVRSLRIDLLVMGSHGRGGIRKLVLGSVAEAILRNMPCPTLICGPECRRLFHPLKSIVLVPAAESEIAEPCGYAQLLAKSFQGKITALHVVPNAQPSAQPDLLSGRLPLALRRPPQPKQLDNLDPKFHHIIRYGNPAVETLKAAARSKANLIVMDIQPATWMADHDPSTFLSRIVTSATCPLLVVPGHPWGSS